MAHFPFLEAASSGCSGILRSFYVPFLSPRACRFSEYQLLQNKKPVDRRRTANKKKKQKPKKIRHL